MLFTADALVMGRKTYEALAAVWPELANVPGYETYAARTNSMPKYVASRTLSEPLDWNATLLEGELSEGITALKDKHSGSLVVVGAGELAHNVLAQGLVDELWFWVSPSLWPTGPRIFDDVGHVRLQLVGATTFSSGVVHLRYRPAPADTPEASNQD